MDGTVGEAGRRGEVGGVATEEAQLGVRVEAAATNPAIEEEIAALEEEGVGGGVARQQGADLGLEFGGELFVGVEREDPGAGAFFNGGVLLPGKALPWFGYDDGVEGAGNLEGAIGGTGVEDDDLVSKLDA